MKLKLGEIKYARSKFSFRLLSKDSRLLPCKFL